MKDRQSRSDDDSNRKLLSERIGILVSMSDGSISLPNTGLFAATAAAQWPPPAASSIVLAHHHGRTGILLTPLTRDGQTVFTLGMRVVFTLGEQPHLVGWQPAEALDINQHSLEIDILASQIEWMHRKKNDVLGADKLRSIGTSLGRRENVEESLDQLADLLLGSPARRLAYLLEQVPRKRLGMLFDTVHRILRPLTDPSDDEIHPPANQPHDTEDTEDTEDTSALTGRILAALPAEHHARAKSTLDLIRGMSTDAAARRLEMLENCPWETPMRPVFSRRRFLDRMARLHIGHDREKAQVADALARIDFARRRRGTITQRCFLIVGEAGIGKTSFARAFADASERPIIHLSLANIHDDVTLLGTSPQYFDSSPGRFMEAIITAGVPDPVVLLDEIDKIGGWDPPSNGPNLQSILLSLIDDSDGHCFTDNFLGLPFPTKAMTFIATANTVTALADPLLDRMEVIPISGYSQEEKVQLIMQRLLPEALREMGVIEGEVLVTADGATALIDRSRRSNSMRALQSTIQHLLVPIIDDVMDDRLVVVDHEYVYLRVSRS